MGWEGKRVARGFSSGYCSFVVTPQEEEGELEGGGPQREKGGLVVQ